MAKDELFDVVSNNDEVIGVATKEECHSNPQLMHRTVHFTLVDIENKKVFLTQRSFAADHDAGKYCFPGEHITSGESYDDAVKRGCEEELGFIPSRYSEACQNIFSYQTQTEFARFFLIEWKGESISYDEEEMEHVLWVDTGTLFGKKHELSDITKYWIENTEWEDLDKYFVLESVGG